jgi:Rod binding domain-containing protein
MSICIEYLRTSCPFAELLEDETYQSFTCPSDSEENFPIQKDRQMTTLTPINPANSVSSDMKLRALADKLESQFLAEMLKSAGVGQPRDAFGGGVGEAQFSSFLTQEYAEATVAAGGIGLSEAIYNALITKELKP